MQADDPQPPLCRAAGLLLAMDSHGHKGRDARFEKAAADANYQQINVSWRRDNTPRTRRLSDDSRVPACFTLRTLALHMAQRCSRGGRDKTRPLQTVHIHEGYTPSREPEPVRQPGRPADDPLPITSPWPPVFSGPGRCRTAAATTLYGLHISVGVTRRLGHGLLDADWPTGRGEGTSCRRRDAPRDRE
ncbi:hypothetical protein GGTG_13137 [Gaeumannomyces tritici R3-111a-1]|uniref:Uncharacterized protein n=1 Tax=Gaeumannomyces tritici (strain R3-111a-1) TaxID=644352 RepID=J3PI06_GAET3|nr:hypothetical protein GGTG_13137 [Gaeumannomyces tritici R3-111a-1]EJT69518.1 hypothetical protein GGTG_13137 [Gaeumannomyces tritici R3-111a-1]